DMYLAERGGTVTDLWGVGGPAARPYPEAEELIGEDRVETAVKVADAFFDAPSSVGVAVAEKFPDALTGGAHIASLGGPILLTPSAGVTTHLDGWLCANADNVTTTVLYGGEAVISQAVAADITGRTSGAAC